MIEPCRNEEKSYVLFTPFGSCNQKKAINPFYKSFWLVDSLLFTSDFFLVDCVCLWRIDRWSYGFEEALFMAHFTGICENNDIMHKSKLM